MGLEEEEKVNRLSQTILKVMRLEVLLAIGLIVWVTSMSGCSSVNHLDAAVFGYKYVDKRVIAEETYEVFQSEKQSDFYSMFYNPVFANYTDALHRVLMTSQYLQGF